MAMHKLDAINLLLLIVVVVSLGNCRYAFAAEGASSHYLPGLAGDIGIAVASPKPGWQTSSSFFYQTGNAGTAVLQGRVDFSLDMDLFLVIPAMSYTFDKHVLGGTYTVSAAVPFGYANLSARLSGFGAAVETKANSFNLSDMSINPIQLNWQANNFYFKLGESVIVPTGAYDKNDLVNLGRNYWSFDTIGALTWLDPKLGTEVSIAPGIMFNTKNNDTDYKTGDEFHVDFVVNQFLMETFAVGLRGYYYKQITGDSGNGARLGDFKSESLGIGPGFAWMPSFAKGDFTLLGKWVRDVQSENRFDSDYFTLIAAWKF